MPWVQKMILGGHRLVVYGKPRERSKRLVIEHPEFEVIEDEAGASLHFDRITPVHGAGDGLPAHIARELIHHALEETDLSAIPRLWPEGRGGAPLLPDVWRAVHFPLDMAECEAARRQLVRDVFFGIQLILASRHASVKKNGGFARLGTGILWKQVETSLPFALTDSQLLVMEEISMDMAAPHRMNRLLQGDVGSGKTMVALRAMIQAHESGWQAALMAPTQILAEQHYLNFRRILDPLEIPVVLRTSSRREDSMGSADLFAANPSRPAIVVGTHALLYEGAEFERLGLVVIDEQHKFGVAQRALLWKKNNIPPHVLVMTATPIPRTLALTAYGDLDYSVMDELPPGRKAIKTVHRFENNRPNVMDFIKDEIAKGRQAYIIYPLIEESSKLDYENLMKGYEEVKSFFPEPNYWVSMVHGKMKADQKETNMQRFVTNDTQIMVSTTVIEVGVNVPNASVMVIESAEKFGLSQLHQLRGRVGRGAEQSFCILLTGSKISKDAAERLKIMVATNDGFKIAEKDLEIRGPGDIEGTQQSGLLNFRLANIVQDKVIVDAAKEQVDSILDTDPDFTLAENLKIKNYLYLQKGKTIWSKIS